MNAADDTSTQVDEGYPDLDSIIASLTLDQSRAIADVRRSDHPDLIDWLHGVEIASEIAKLSGCRFPSPFSWWEDHDNIDPEKPRSYFFAVLGSPEEARQKIRERLETLGMTPGERDQSSPDDHPWWQCQQCFRRTVSPEVAAKPCNMLRADWCPCGGRFGTGNFAVCGIPVGGKTE